MLTYIFAIICLFGSWLMFYEYQKKQKLLFKIKDIPYVGKHYPIIGLGHIVIGKSPEETFNLMLNVINSEPTSLTKGFLFNKLVISVKGPADIKKILSSPECLEKAVPYSQVALNGLVTSKVALWKPHRKMLNPTLHLTLLRNEFMQHFNDIAQHLVTDFQCKVGSDAFDIGPMFSLRSTELQLKAMFDVVIDKEKLRILSDNNKKLFEMMGDGAIGFYHLAVFVIGQFFKIDLPGENILNDSYKYLEPFIENARKQYLEKLHVTGLVEDAKTKPEILIHKVVALVEQGYFTEESKKKHIKTMLVAGADTMSTSLSNCILCLAMNEEAQEQCANEIKEIMGDQFDNVTIDNLIKLELLDRTINECLRLIPTVPIVGRTCNKDFKLDDNRIIPAGSDIIIPIITVHRNKEYWGANATTFNPDNFLPENIAKRPPLSYMPYSYGIRNCIAKKYAQHGLKVILAYLLVNYKFSTDLKFDELKFAFGITIILRNRHMIRIEKREF